jgi:hypothetical protein
MVTYRYAQYVQSSHRHRIQTDTSRSVCRQIAHTGRIGHITSAFTCGSLAASLRLQPWATVELSVTNTALHGHSMIIRRNVTRQAVAIAMGRLPRHCTAPMNGTSLLTHQTDESTDTTQPARQRQRNGVVG